MKMKESLTEEIIANARRDRKRLELVADSLIQKYNDIKEEIEQHEGVALDPETAAAFAEEISKLSDSLTKVNQQLVELVKIEHRRVPPEEPTKLGKQEVEEVFNEIQPQEVN